jgi:glycerol-3-phosphate acyltransferase PlsY
MIATVAILAAWIVGGYLVGAIPFGWLIGTMRGVDIRQLGSKNIGATNCGRVCGWPFGVAAFLLDVAKGFVPVFTAVAWIPGVTAACLDIDHGGLVWHWVVVVGVAACPILGHVFPIYLGFRGGKAVATALGVVLALPMLRWPALAAFGLWVIQTAASGYVSVGSTAAAMALGAGYLWREQTRAWNDYLAVTLFVLLLVIMVIARHRSNYARLLKGTENGVLWRKKKAANHT